MFTDACGAHRVQMWYLYMYINGASMHTCVFGDACMCICTCN